MAHVQRMVEFPSQTLALAKARRGPQLDPIGPCRARLHVVQGGQRASDRSTRFIPENLKHLRGSNEPSSGGAGYERQSRLPQLANMSRNTRRSWQGQARMTSLNMRLSTFAAFRLFGNDGRARLCLRAEPVSRALALYTVAPPPPTPQARFSRGSSRTPFQDHSKIHKRIRTARRDF